MLNDKVITELTNKIKDNRKQREIRNKRPTQIREDLIERKVNEQSSIDNTEMIATDKDIEERLIRLGLKRTKTHYTEEELQAIDNSYQVDNVESIQNVMSPIKQAPKDIPAPTVDKTERDDDINSQIATIKPIQVSTLNLRIPLEQSGIEEPVKPVIRSKSIQRDTKVDTIVLPNPIKQDTTQQQQEEVAQMQNSMSARRKRRNIDNEK